MNKPPLEMSVNSHGLHLDSRAQKAISRGVSRLDVWTKKFPSRNGRLNISKRNRDGIHRVELILELPQKTIVAHDEVPSLITAVDRAFRKAARQLREFKAVLRRDHMHRDVRESRQGMEELSESKLAEVIQQRDLELFREMAGEHISRLQGYLKRETGALRRRYHGVKFSVPDLVEETLAEALERFDEKPGGMPVNQWLYGVAVDLVERQALTGSQDAAESALRIDESLLPAPHDLVEDLLDEWLVTSEVREDHAGGGTDSIEDQFAAPGPEDPAVAAENHDLKERVLQVMGELPMSWRRSFVLHFVEGFDFQEIAQIHNVTNEQVRFQVQSAELFLRERLAELAIAI